MQIFDLFHQNVKLNYKESHRFATRAGYFFTCCVVVITVIQAYSTFTSILSFGAPQVTSDRTVFIDPPSISLSPSDFRFFIHVRGLNLSSSYVSFNLFTHQVWKDSTGMYNETRTNITFRRCTEEDLKIFDKRTYPPEIYYQGICPELDHVQLNGSIHSEYYQTVQLILTTCVNDTNHPDIVCKSSDEIANQLSSRTFTLELYYSNTILSPTNYTTPFIYHLDFAQYMLSPGNFTIESDIFISQQDIITDDHLLIPGWKPKIQSTYQIDNTEVKTRVGRARTFSGQGGRRPGGSGGGSGGSGGSGGGSGGSGNSSSSSTYMLISVNFEVSRNKYTMKRLYPKLQQGLANVGSVFSLSVGIFGFLTALYVYRAYAVNIATQIYEIDMQNPKNRPNNGKKDERSKKKKGCCKAICKKKKPKSQTEVTANTEEDLLPLKELTRKKQTISYTFLDFLLSFCPCIRRKRNLLLKKAIKAAVKEIDLLNIVRRLQELERLKKILLDEDELRMLSFTQTPVISLEKPSPSNENLSKSEKTKKRKTKTDTASKKRSLKADFRELELKSIDSLPPIPKINSKKSDKSDNFRDFEASFQSYHRLLKRARSSRTSQRILTLMDPKISNTFFDFGAKSTEGLGRLTHTLSNLTKTLSEKGPRVRSMSKLEAGLIITRSLERHYSRQRKRNRRDSGKLIFSNSDSPNNESPNNESPDNESPRNEANKLELFNIGSERRLLNPVAEQTETVNRAEQDSHYPSRVSIQFNDSSFSNSLYVPSLQHGLSENSKGDPGTVVSRPQLKETDRNTLPQIDTFPKSKTFTINSDFDVMSPTKEDSDQRNDGIRS